MRVSVGFGGLVRVFGGRVPFEPEPFKAPLCVACGRPFRESRAPLGPAAGEGLLFFSRKFL